MILSKGKILFTICTFLLLIAVFFLAIEGEGQPLLKINEHELEIKVADSDQERKEGLSGVEKLSESQGLVLEFDEMDYHSIWMKDMNFSIDIIWINDQKEVVDFATFVPPDSFPESFKPAKKAKYVLETNAGFVEETGLTIGEEINFYNYD